ncbi:MAG: hydrogenase maturation nickel metallochaperone HypA, partial [Calditrichia bacterium]|nr:hydrogenase maturation nickel metallochaperone HypA [Calditrichia bacterium]
MHEMSIAQSILDIVDEYMTKENGRKLMEVAVEVGELVAV